MWIALTVSSVGLAIRSSTLTSTIAPSSGLMRFVSWVASWSSAIGWPPSVMSATRLSPVNAGAVLPALHLADAVEFAAPTPIAGTPGCPNSVRSSTRASPATAWSMDAAMSGSIVVLALPVTAPMTFGGMPSCVAVLPAPVSESAQSVRSALAPFAVLMLPLATIGSTRFWPVTEAYTALARHCQTGALVAACAAWATVTVPITNANAARGLRVIAGSPCIRGRLPPGAVLLKAFCVAPVTGGCPRHANARPVRVPPRPSWRKNSRTESVLKPNLPGLCQGDLPGRSGP